MTDTIELLEDKLIWFRSAIEAWNTPISADMDLYDFTELSLNTLEAFDWIKREYASGAPIKCSRSPDEVIMDFAKGFFERFHSVFQSIMITGRNDREEVIEMITPFIAKLCEVADNKEAIMRMASTCQNGRLDKAYQELAEARAKRKRLDDCLSEVMYYRGVAKECEIEGDLIEAACNLEKAIIHGESSALNPHDYLAAHERLFVLYRKLRRYSDEERTLLDAINLEMQFDNPNCKRRIEKYQDKLAKCRILIQKYE